MRSIVRWWKGATDPTERIVAALKGKDLPSFPAVVLKVLRTLRDPASSRDDIAEQLALDPQLTVEILRLANSGAYAVRNGVSDVGQAVTLLGRSEVESLVLASGVRRMVRDFPDGFDPAAFWARAAAQAAGARCLAASLHPATRREAFVGALLQDFAVPLLVGALGEEYARIAAAPHEELEALERKRYGWTHPEVGAVLATRWDLPEHLIGAIASHHDLEAAHEKGSAAVALVAHLFPTDPESAGRVASLTAERFGGDAVAYGQELERAVESSAGLARELSP